MQKRKLICKACWRELTANKGEICTGCLNLGLSAQPRARSNHSVLKSVKTEEPPDDEPVARFDDNEPAERDEDEDCRTYTDED